MRDHWPITILASCLLLLIASGCAGKAPPVPVSPRFADASGGAARVQVRLDTIGGLAIELTRHVATQGRQLLEQIQAQSAAAKKETAALALDIAVAGAEQAKAAVSNAQLQQELADERNHYWGYRLRAEIKFWLAMSALACVVFYFAANFITVGLAMLGGRWFSLAKVLVGQLPFMGKAAKAIRQMDVGDMGGAA